MDTDTDTDSDTELSYEEMRPFQCVKCCNRFITESELSFHTELVHSKGLYQCAKCVFSCRGIGQMTLHNQNHIRENRNINSYRTTPNQISFRTDKFQSNHRTKNGHIKGNNSGNSSDEGLIKIPKTDVSDSNKENENNSYISESSSDSASDSHDVRKNKKGHKIRLEINKHNRPISTCSSTNKKRKIYEGVSSSNDLNVSVCEHPEITNLKGEVTNAKTKIEACVDVTKSRYNDSDSDFHDKSSYFDNEENNVNDKIKTPSHSGNGIISENPKKGNSSLQLDLIQANFKNNDNTVTNKTDSSKLLTANTNPDEHKGELRFTNVYKNSEKSTKIECKVKQEHFKQMCKSHQTSDSENENKNRDKSGNKKQIYNEYAKDRVINDNEKDLYKRRTLSDGDQSKNENQKHKYHSNRHDRDSKRETKHDCKTASKKQIFNLDKSEIIIIHNKKKSHEKTSNNKSDSEDKNKQKNKSKSEKERSDTEKDNKLSYYKSVSEKKILDSSKSKKRYTDRTKNGSERSLDIRDSEYETKCRQKIKLSNSKTGSKNKEKKTSSSQSRQKSNPIKTNDASNKDENKYVSNKENVENGEKINEKEKNRKQNDLDIQNVVDKSKSCYISGNGVFSLDSQRETSIVLVSPKTLSCSETQKSAEKQAENIGNFSSKEKNYNKQLINETISVNTLIKEVQTKGISEQNGSKIKTEVCHNDPKKYNVGFCQNENGKKSSKLMCTIPKENIKDMISNTEGTGITSESGNDAKITKIERNERVIQQSEDVIDGNIEQDLNSREVNSPNIAKIKKIKRIDMVIQQFEDVFVENQPDYKCKTCDKTFERRRKLKRHLISGKCFGKGSDITQVGNKSNDSYVTDVNFPSSSEGILNKINWLNKSTHLNDDIDTKSKSISNKKSVYSTHKVEILMAKVEKIGNKFQCPVCSKILNSSGILKRHLIIHTGEMPFLCTSCDSTFNQKIQLQKHMKTVHNEGMFRCKICSENFVQEIYMRRHMAKHTGINPFPCTICPENFVLERDLKKHMRKDHEN